MRRIVTRCLWGITVLVLVATLVLSGATIGTTIAASLAPLPTRCPCSVSVRPPGSRP
jgi:hypothetical protein